ncbi:enoyl-CoA hydratase/isomerase family protein [Nocardioides sp. cx-173]|uniref:enoyl-CoA hydratase/isomerase family protein n=1 Tax=Nocardioides sp. cx-173 TaxID=2898796 RepID=UPI001E4228C7|nr:enoyl-CoA hydratase/isomerase family protein [Nocardioides sp. cx-173]MCD4526866.1 enoyl-CoA hydratase/isomerase family protein [Nocardioides sp. cx-173]UGB41345.1 enoyl-CoA hydratase/isomerase family protein [Nocardioides sp. cx-173]
MSIARLVLDRPDRANALDAATVERLHDELSAAGATADVVVLEARGRAFCGGLDLATLDEESDADLLLRLVRIQLLLERLAALPPLTVALVQGAAVGAGADLALAADVRLGLPGASLRFPGAGFGAVLGTARLAALTSPSFATEAAATGRRISGIEASEHGLLTPPGGRDEAEAEVTRLAEATRCLPPGTTAALRRAAGVPSVPDPLAQLVRSLAGRPGLRDRVRQYRDRSAPARTPAPEGAR